MTLSEVTKLAHDLFEQSERIRDLMSWDDVAELQKTCVVTGIWPHGTVSYPCITKKNYSDLIFPKFEKDKNQDKRIRITNKTLIFGINDNIKSIWQRFVNEGIIPELEQQGVEIVYN